MKTLNLPQPDQILSSKRLDLSGGLTEFPLEILDVADRIEVLNLSNNHLSTLPDDFARFQNLKVVFFNNNNFEVFPEVLTQCPNLYMISFKANRLKQIDEHVLAPTIRWLTLTDNQLETLPASIGNLNQLQKLMLAGNRLQTLPEELAACQSLELIRLAANRLTELPTWLFTLPRLSWLAYSGNPFCTATPHQRPSVPISVGRSLPVVNWSDLTLGDVLGEGASGVIYKATWKTQDRVEEVAVKVFKGDVTSDGLPADEMRACIEAGSHQNLVQVLGKLGNAPNSQEGLIFSLIPPHYGNLGNPPSLQSCTRDTYPADLSFTLSTILTTVKGVASVAAHLHQQGIMHGDLYPHNTLITETGDCLLGDFGAASFYDPRNGELAQACERLEVRAFGCLLEDMLDRCTEVDLIAQAEQMYQLRQLQQDCMNPNPSLRPLFEAIGERLHGVC
ncbi:MAG: serine/threonine-protein kinase [Synechococcales cyanobacterium T60_A2020_003]|nr:serine/threonine-protein kinase [Synechococcales cyanobacterium T60_A2020_003]